ncbi:MAG: serine/threonine-protein kinase PknK [Aureliella sp.]
MAKDINQVERDFREEWRGFAPEVYANYLDQVTEDQRLELLCRIIIIELEYSFCPPSGRVEPVDEDEARATPSLALLLFRFPELRSKPEYVLKLCVVEYAQKLRYGKQAPRPESYLQLYEENPDRLLQLLLATEQKLPSVKPNADPDSALPNANDLTVKDEAGTSISLEQLPTNLGCFLLVELISRGGMGFVYSAIDLRNTASVAVKVMRRDDAWSVFRFQEEFSWLTSVNHPNLVKLYDACVEGDMRYFSMELVEGKVISEWFRRHAKRRDDPWKYLRQVLAQAASAVQYLHHIGALHCDIKCTNLMITSSRRAVLLDLGLAVREDSPNTEPGTFQYSAPEVVRGDGHSRSSDWFSFGLMIYEVIAGGFELRYTDGLAGQRVLDIEDVRRQMKHAPEEIVDLCCDLLADQPDERPEGNEVVERLGGELKNRMSWTHFVGRQKPLEKLQQASTALASGTSSSWIIEGESGIGKSSLIKRWLRSLPQSEYFVLHASCFRQDQTPNRLANSLLQQIFFKLQPLPESIWKPELEIRVESISKVFPQVKQLLEPGQYFSPPESRPNASAQMESQAFAMLSEWMQTINALRPFIIVVDDAQWADRASLSWLRRYASDHQFNVMLVIVDETSGLVFDSLYGEQLSSNEESIQTTRLQLDSLTEEESNELVARAFETTELSPSPRIINNLIERSQGSPFLLEELFHTYAYYANRDGISDDDWLHRSMLGSIRSRFSLLPTRAELILQYLAVAGRPLTFHQIETVTRLQPKSLQKLLNVLENQGWVSVRTSQIESSIDIGHEKFRQTILSTLPSERLKRRHARLARMLSTNVPPPWSRMGEHFWLADQFREAAACYLQAAQRAYATGALKEALEFMERAKHPLADRNDTESRQFKLLEANCLAGQGNAKAAARLFEQLAKTSEPSETPSLNAKTSEAWIHAGFMEDAMESVSSLLRDLSISDLRKSRRSKLRLIWKLSRRESPQHFLHSKSSAEPFDELYGTLNRIGFPMTFLDNQLGPDIILRMKDFAGTNGNEADKAIAALHYALLLLLTSRRRRREAIAWLRVGRILARRSQVPAAMGRYYFCYWLMYIQKGQRGAGLRIIDRSLDAFSQDPERCQWEIQFIQWCQLASFHDQASFKEMRRRSVRLREHAIESGDSMSQYLMHVLYAHESDLVEDDLEAAKNTLGIAQRAITSRSYQMPRFYLWLTESRHQLYEGNFESALHILDSDWRRMKQAYLLSHSHNLWLALKLKAACQLAKRDYQQAIKTASKLRGLKDRVYRAHGDAIELVANAGLGQKGNPEDWMRTAQTLDVLGQKTDALGLRWHASLRFNEGQIDDDYASGGLEALIHENVRNPNRFMNLVLPLPKI